MIEDLLGFILKICGLGLYSGLILYTGRDWGQEEKGTTEHEMAGWHY